MYSISQFTFLVTLPTLVLTTCPVSAASTGMKLMSRTRYCVDLHIPFISQLFLSSFTLVGNEPSVTYVQASVFHFPVVAFCLLVLLLY